MKKIIFILSILFSLNNYSQIISNEVFINGSYVEVGVNSFGAYGTNGSAPTGYHPKLGVSTAGRNLGFVADPAKDGWTTGTPNFYGDFFYPGQPQEGFSVQFNNNVYHNWTSGINNIPGSNLSLVTDATKKVSVWEGNVTGLKIVQKTEVPLNEVFFVVKVELTNTTATTLNDVYYVRTLDPDNEVTITDNYTTVNSVTFDLPNPQGNTLVSARGTTVADCYLGLGTKDCRANSFILTSGLYPSPSTLLSDIYNQIPSYVYTGNYTEDSGIGISFKIGNILPGETKKFAFTYILKESDLEIALNQTLPEILINSTSSVVSGSNYNYCENSSINLSVLNSEEYTWHWEPESYFSSPYGDNVTVTVPNSTVNFTVTGTSDCTPITINFSITPQTFATTLDEENHVICSGSSTSYNPLAGVTSPVSTINWYDAPVGGTLLSTSPTFNTGVLTNASATPVEYVYYFEETTPNGCVSERIPYKVKVYNTLALPNSELKKCTFGATTAEFNLLEYQDLITPIDNAVFTYYNSIFNLNNNIPIANPSTYTNTVNNEIIYVKVVVNATCSTVLELTLRVFEQIAVTPATLKGCDTDFDSKFEFDLTDANASINTNADSVFSYYLTEANSIQDINPILNFTTYTNLTNPQTIYVRVSNANCVNYSTITLTVFDKPILANAVLNSCEENLSGSANFDLTAANTLFSPDTTITYNFATSLANLNSNIYLTSAQALNFENTANPQIIYVRGTNASGCYTDVELELTVNPVNRYTVSDFNKCDDNFDSFVAFNLNDKITDFVAVLPVDTYTYTYYTSELNALQATSPIASTFTNTISPEQMVYVRAQGINGCFHIISFKLIVLVKPVLTVPTQKGICLGVPITLDAGSGFDQYLWSTGETTQTITVTTDGIYNIKVTNYYGAFYCETSQNITVVPSDIAIISGIDVQDFTYDQNVLSVNYSGIGDYEFSLNGIEYQDSSVFENLESGTYTVYVRDKNGCGVVTKDAYILMYPLYFTPNSDGYNDYWNIDFSVLEEGLYVNIFDRYGKLLKVISGKEDGWDGKYNGALMPSSDYWFVVKRKDKKDIKGHFTLKR